MDCWYGTVRVATGLYRGLRDPYLDWANAEQGLCAGVVALLPAVCCWLWCGLPYEELRYVLYNIPAVSI